MMTILHALRVFLTALVFLFPVFGSLYARGLPASGDMPSLGDPFSGALSTPQIHSLDVLPQSRPLSAKPAPIPAGTGLSIIRIEDYGPQRVRKGGSPIVLTGSSSWWVYITGAALLAALLTALTLFLVQMRRGCQTPR